MPSFFIELRSQLDLSMEYYNLRIDLDHIYIPAIVTSLHVPIS